MSFGDEPKINQFQELQKVVFSKIFNEFAGFGKVQTKILTFLSKPIFFILTLSILINNDL